LREPALRQRAPDFLRESVRQIAEPPRREARSRETATAWFWKYWAFGATAFAALLLFLRPVGMSDHDRLVDEAIAGHVRSLMVAHLTDIVSSDQHTVKPWFDGKIDFAPNVKDFATNGFPLIGGRLDYLDNHTVAALVYGRNKHFINVFIWPDGAESKSETLSRRGYSVINTSAHGFRYCFVSDLNAKELGDLAELCTQ
jgi:anti-sigma factor RsiW